MGSFAEDTRSIQGLDGFPKPVRWILFEVSNPDSGKLKINTLATNGGNELHLGSFSRLWYHSSKVGMSLADGSVMFRIGHHELLRAADDLLPVVESMPDNPHDNYHAICEGVATTVSGGFVVLVAITNDKADPTTVASLFERHLNRNR